MFDDFVFTRYANAAQSKENSDTLKRNLEELSSYFPEIDKIGIKNDLQNYFNAWKSLAANPSNTSLKESLAQQTQTLSQHIQETRSKIHDLQTSLNDQVKVNIDEVNRISEQIAQINSKINQAESISTMNANDLRDQRSQDRKSVV